MGVKNDCKWRMIVVVRVGDRIYRGAGCGAFKLNVVNVLQVGFRVLQKCDRCYVTGYNR